MLYLTVLSVALAVALAVAFLLETVPSRPRGVTRRLAEIEILGAAGSAAVQRRRRLSRRESFADLLTDLGKRIPTSVLNDTSLTHLLRQAGYDGPRAIPLFWGIRLGVTATLGVTAALATTFIVAKPSLVTLASLYFALVGWILPGVWVRHRRRRRQNEMASTLPDVLDFLVVCVEAGLGLNQALVRVSHEIAGVARELGKELALTNLQIRAGVARSDSLQDLADRTGLPAVQSLVTTLVQTDRFGTSVARSLRVHADTLRQKRRQAAEEAAAKTTIKMVFPLVLCVFPAIFVVLLSPGVIRFVQTMGAF